MSWITSFKTVLHSRNARLLLLASGISAYGDWLFVVALRGLMMDLGGAKALTASSMLPYVGGLVFAPVAGMMADRWKRGRLMIGADLVRALGMFAIAILLARGQAGVTSIIGIIAAGTLFGCVFRTARMSLIPAVIPKDNLLAVNSLDGSITTSSLALAPALGGLLAASGLTRTWLFLLNGLSFVLAALLVAFVDGGAPESPAPLEANAEAPAKPRDSWLDGLKVLFGMPSLRPVAVLLFFTCVAAGSHFVSLVLLAARIRGGGDAAIGYITSALGLGVMAGMFFGGTLKQRDRRTVASIAIALSALAISLSGMFAVWPWVLGAAGLIGFTSGVGEVQMFTTLQMEIPEDVRGRAFGAVEFIFIGGLLLGSTVLGVAADRLGVHAANQFIGVSVGACAVISLAMRLRQRRGEATFAKVSAVEERAPLAGAE